MFKINFKKKITNQISVPPLKLLGDTPLNIVYVGSQAFVTSIHKVLEKIVYHYVFYEDVGWCIIQTMSEEQARHAIKLLNS